MSYIQQDPVLCCDTCNTVLNGQDRAAHQTKNFLKIQGTFHMEVFVPEIRRYIFKKITKTGAEELHFCDFKCLEGYAEGRISGFDQAMKDGRLLVRGLNDGAYEAAQKLRNSNPSMERSPYRSAGTDRSEEEEQW